MKKGCLFLIFVLLASCGAFAEITGSVADPSDIGVGARPLALGKAYVGLSDDANGLFMNPAGLAGIKNFKATSMSGQVIQDVNYAIVGGATPTDYGVFGLGYTNVGLPNIPVTQTTGSGTSETVVTVGQTTYYSSVLTLLYSNDLSGIEYFKDHKNFTYGVNLKYFMQGFQGGGTAMKGANGTGLDMDLGLQYKPSTGLTLGLSGLNILPSNLGGKFIWDKGGVEESIPAVVKAGFSARIFGKDSFYGGKQDVLLGMDMDAYPSQNRPSVYHTGLEWSPISVMALRAGIDQKPKGTEDMVGVDNNLTAGIGLKFNGFTFDYCYHQFSDLTENTTHFFSIGYVGLDEDKKTAERPKRIIPVVVPSVSLETFSDVPNGFWAKSPVEFMTTLGVMDGYFDGKFRPDAPVSRAELAAMIVKLKELDVNEATSDPYPDVSKDYWAAKYVKAVSYLHLMRNYPDGTFKPEKKITRVEGIVALSRFTEAKEPATLSKDPFIDVSQKHWAAKNIAAAQNYGLLDYLIGKKFDPNKELTRAEVAELLSKTGIGKDRIRKFLRVGS
ncbi:MAG: S-layer homology domain-containing protein [bacterium]